MQIFISEHPWLFTLVLIISLDIIGSVIAYICGAIISIATKQPVKIGHINSNNNDKKEDDSNTAINLRK